MNEIKIKCPECAETFDVSDELLGVDVECGTCKCAFELTSHHVVETEFDEDGEGRQYPGEKAAELGAFSAFSESASSADQIEKVAFEKADYNGAYRAERVGVVHVLAVVIGISLMLGVIGVFMVGGFLESVTAQERWILAGFSALVGGLLVVYGMSKYRALGVFFAFILSAVLAAMPLLFPIESENDGMATGSNEQRASDPDSSGISTEEEKLKRYKQELGYGTVESKILKAQAAEDVLAIALIHAKPAHMDTIKKYLGHALNTEEFPRVYFNRKVNGASATLLVYLKSKVSLDQAATALKKVGVVTAVRSEMRVIDVLVDLDSLKSDESDVLLDPSKHGFFLLNLAELRNIDQKRQLAAVLRLSKVEHLKYRSDVQVELVRLFQSEVFPYKSELAEAMVTWSVAGDGAAELLVKEARKIAVMKGKVPASFLRLLIKQKVKGVGDILLYAWLCDCVAGEPMLVSAGRQVEASLLEVLPDLEPMELRSAANILRKIGSQSSLPALLIAYESSKGDVKKSLKATIDEIKSRD